MKSLHEWNEKIRSDGSLEADWFWDNFKIKSWPKFKDRCAFYIPKLWGDDVKEMVNNIQSKHGDKVEFGQIKEKFITLTVYFDCPEEIREDVENEISICKNKLINKGLHIKGKMK